MASACWRDSARDAASRVSAEAGGPGHGIEHAERILCILGALRDLHKRRRDEASSIPASPRPPAYRRSHWVRPAARAASPLRSTG